MPLYALTIFAGAFLLFQIQPIMGKVILPWFGGGASIWTTCLLFFQLLLLAGYIYAHLLSSRLGKRTQARLHIALLAASVAAYLLAPDAAAWKPEGTERPALRILLLLLFTIGLPYFVLSTTSPLIQRWFNWRFPAHSPYRLYALSNIASVLALLSYPVLVESTLTVGAQVGVWTGTYIVFCVLCAACAWRVPPGPAASDLPAPEPIVRRPVPARTLALWILLAATGSALLLATTNQLCQEVAVVPFLWVLPLSLYLLSFIICFDNERWYDRRVFGALLLLATPIATEMLVQGTHPPMKLQIPVYLTALFAGCMCCHGELVRAKPAPEHLTLFYLCASIGGALGGVFVALLAPALFLGYWEYHLSLWAACLLTLLCWRRSPAWRTTLTRPAWLWAPLTLFMVLLTLVLLGQVWSRYRDTLDARRNFYGVASVIERMYGGDLYRALRHGRIVHGIQNLEPGKADWPTSYFGPATGLGLALTRYPARTADPPRAADVAVLGLGIGTIATYALPGDRFHYYEIDPQVETLARTHFTYLDDSAADITVTLGDGRMMMERELQQHPEGNRYDIMVFDAFSSDAIPVHLITIECVETYWRLLKPDGLLVFNISNRYIDLTPVCNGIVQHFGCTGLYFSTEDDPDTGQFGSSWVVFTRNQDFLDDPAVTAGITHRFTPDDPVLTWTDDFASLWKVIKR